MKAWIMTTNDDATRFYARSEYFDIGIVADSWSELLQEVEAFTRLAESIPYVKED